MKEIWKYEINMGITNLEIPENAKILCVQIQNENPYIWVKVNPENKMEKREFVLYGTGHSILQDGSGKK